MQLYNGKCEEILKDMEDNSIDAVVTDPPYGLSFMNKKWDYDVPNIDTFKEILRVMKPGATLLCFAGTRTQHRMAINIEDAGFLLKDTLMWLYGSGFPKSTDISKQIDKNAGKEREVIGEGSRHGGGRKGGNFYSDSDDYDDYGSGFITAPATDEAKLWNGWKSHGLKPAYEPIIMAIKSNDGSYTENALKWGVSGINIDDCRIKADDQKQLEKNWNRKNITDMRSGNYGRGKPSGIKLNTEASNKGRYPSNVILTHHPECEFRKCHEDCPVKILDRASRFFYCAKASKSERNIGCGDIIEKRGSDDYRPNDDGTKGLQSRLHGATKKGSNNHPTVKPIKLIKYLCKMVSMPTKITVLDPYMGSGTTGMACIELGLDFIGIEKDKEYFEIAKARFNQVKYEVIEKPIKIMNDVSAFFKVKGD